MFRTVPEPPSVAPLLTVTSLEESAPLTSKVPALTTVGLLWRVPLPDRTSVPRPALIRLAGGRETLSERTPPKVVNPVFTTVTVNGAPDPLGLSTALPAKVTSLEPPTVISPLTNTEFSTRAPPLAWTVVPPDSDKKG